MTCREEYRENFAINIKLSIDSPYGILQSNAQMNLICQKIAILSPCFVGERQHFAEISRWRSNIVFANFGDRPSIGDRDFRAEGVHGFVCQSQRMHGLGIESRGMFSSGLSRTRETEKRSPSRHRERGCNSKCIARALHRRRARLHSCLPLLPLFSSISLSPCHFSPPRTYIRPIFVVFNGGSRCSLDKSI